jgi:nitrogenase molybdenum-cofactor synthesis protein NifE
MKYEEAVKRIKRLSQIEKTLDIYGDCAAIAGGIFCPAHGVALAAPYIQDAAVIVVGMAECTWYAKNSGEHYTRHMAGERFYSCVLEDADIAFGFGDQLVDQIVQVARQTHCACVILASTCIPEIIGEDIETAANEAEKICGRPVLLIHTSHFDYRCYEYEIAVERLLLALGRLMTPQKAKPKTVNFIGIELHGSRKLDHADNELTRLLLRHGVQTNMTLLNRCHTAMIARAPAAQLNILTHRVGLPLARFMEEQFHIPYVLFQPSLDIEEIAKEYEQIERALELSLPERVLFQEQAETAVESARPVCTGRSVVNGGRPPDAIETTAFLVLLGLRPLLINAARLYPTTGKAIDAILRAGFDPYVNYVANPHIAAAIMERELPELYIGHGHTAWLQKLSCAKLKSVKPESALGFEAVSGGAENVKNAFLNLEKGGGTR